MARVACIMMQKNEGELLRAWIEYHSHLVGRFNIFIFDNASDDALTLRILEKYQRQGLSINRLHVDRNSFVDKGRIFGEFIKEIDASGNFDFYFPLDCDEFIAVKREGEIVLDPNAIHAELHTIMRHKQALGLDTAFYNMLGRPEHFFEWPAQKTFFSAGTFEWMDSGFHDGRSRIAKGKHRTNFAYIHYHHKPYRLLVEHSKNKLRPFFDPDDPVQLQDPRNKNRLTDFILQGEESYMSKFQAEGTWIPQVAERFASIGVRLPFT